MLLSEIKTISGHCGTPRCRCEVAEISEMLRWVRGHRHSKALTVPYSADNRTETSPEASSAPLPCREMSRMRGVEVYPGITLAAAIEGREVGAEVLRLQARER